MRQTISLRQSLFHQIAETARELRISPSRLMAQAIEEFVQRHQNRQYLQQINEAYADAPDEEEQELSRAALRMHRRLLSAEEDQW